MPCVTMTVAWAGCCRACSHDRNGACGRLAARLAAREAVIVVIERPREVRAPVGERLRREDALDEAGIRLDREAEPGGERRDGIAGAHEGAGEDAHDAAGCEEVRQQTGLRHPLRCKRSIGRLPGRLAVADEVERA